MTTRRVFALGIALGAMLTCATYLLGGQLGEGLHNHFVR